MGKSVPRVTVWHHEAEPRDAKTMTLGTDLPIRTSSLMSDSYIMTTRVLTLSAGTSNVMTTSVTTMHFSLKSHFEWSYDKQIITCFTKNNNNLLSYPGRYGS